MPVHNTTSKALWRIAMALGMACATICSVRRCQAATQEQLYPVPVRGKYGFMDRRGRIAIQPLFDRVRLFSEGMAVVAIGGKYGYIDTRGSVIVPPKFEDAASFSEWLAAVEVGKKWGYVDKSGRLVIEPRLGSELGGGGSFSEGLAPVLFNGKMGYINHSGHFVIEPRFDLAEQFSEGLAAVGMVVNDSKVQDSRIKFGYIDKTGKIAVAFGYAGARSFHEGLAVVSIYRIGVKFYPQAVIDHAGAQVSAPFDVGISDFHEGLARINQNENIGFMDKTGKQVIPPQFREFDDRGPSEFYEGLAAVSLPNGRSGYINHAGRMVLAARFGIACPFVEGVALVFERGRIGYIDRTGKYIWSGSTNQMPNNEEAGCF